MPAPRTQTHAAIRRATVRAVLLVLIGSIGVQISSALSFGLFDSLGAIGTSALRLAIAAILLVAIFRPSLRGRTRADWIGILLYGVAMAAMNTLLFLAIERIPLGIATTIDFLGPCLVALIGSRRPREGLLALLAFVGVALIAGLGGPLDGLGVLFAALGGVSFGLYTLLAARIGKSTGGLQNMTLSVVVAAILMLPFSVSAVPSTTPAAWGILLAAGVLGMALAFVVDTIAGRLTSARVIGVLFAFDPVVGSIVGALWLGQVLTLPVIAGIVLVVLAGAGIVWLAGQRETRAVASLEIERKYDVQDRASLPAPTDFARIGLSLDAAETHELEARYFDTAKGLLASHRMAVRRRSGGKDAGWHLKVRGDEGVHEFQWPLSPEPPEGLLAELERRLREEFRETDLAPIATMRTVRTTTIVRGPSGEPVVELADDAVDATNELTGGREEWREWEAELLPGAGRSVLDLLEPLLLGAGATPALGTSKIQRTMSLVPPGETP